MFRSLVAITFTTILAVGCGGSGGTDNSNQGDGTNQVNDGNAGSGSGNSSGSGLIGNDGGAIFFENFDREFELHSTSGSVVSNSVINISTLSQFTVEGEVDLVRSDDGFNISCPNNAGYCLDLDGTDGDTATLGKVVSNSISFAAGEYTLEFSISGNQRIAGNDSLIVSIEPFLSETRIDIDANQSFEVRRFDFSVGSPTSANLEFSLAGTVDNYGPILDDIRIDSVPATPEPLACADAADAGFVETTENGLVSNREVFAGSALSIRLAEDVESNPYLMIAQLGADTTTRVTNAVYLSQADVSGYVVVTAPNIPGEYEVRLIGGNEVLSSKRINVLAPTLSAESSVAGGSTIDICWSGPSISRGFYAIITEVGADSTDRVTDYEYLIDEDGFSTVSLTTPPFPEIDYEIRIVVDDAVVASRPLSILAPTIEAPTSAPAGSTVNFVWTGPSVSRSFYAIIAETAADSTDRSTDYEYLLDEDGTEEIDLNTPLYPDRDYEFRIIVDGVVVAKKSIDILPPTIVAPLTAEADSTVDVEWEGPSVSNRFYMIIAEAGADTTDRVTDYQYLTDEDGFGTVTLRTPADPDKQYELRIIVGDEVVASSAIDVI